MNSKTTLLYRMLLRNQHSHSLKTLTYNSIRSFAGGHGHGHGHGEDLHHYDSIKSHQTKFKIPTQEDIDYQLPKKGIFTERFHQWVAGRWQPDRDDVLDNDNVNKTSAYYWWSSLPLLQSSLVLRLTRSLFDNSRSIHSSHHDSLGGVKTHENGQFLYKSNQADAIIRSRILDYFVLFSLAGWAAGVNQLLFLPIIVVGMQLPRKLAVLQHFTYHAELLPHTEQVVFHKASLFGQVRRIYVDIKNLEKVEPEVVPSQLLFQINMFDSDLVFRDQESKEIFVFDKNGIWNEDTLKHKLLF